MGAGPRAAYGKGMCGGCSGGPSVGGARAPVSRGVSEPAPPRWGGGRAAWTEWAPALVALVAFARAVGFELLDYDDPLAVTANPLVSHPTWAGAWRILSGPLQGDYQPLYYLSLAAECALHGGAPWALHATNVLLHALSVALAQRLLAPRIGRGRACAAAILFAVHPLVVEPVAWVASRKDVLMLPLLLAAVLAYRRGVEGRGPYAAWALASLGLGAAAVLSKTAAVVVPGLLLVDRLASPAPLRLRREAVFFVSAGALGIAGVVAKVWALNVLGAPPVIAPAGVLGRGALVAHTLGAFLQHALLPAGLGLGYDPERAGGLEYALRLAAPLLAVLLAWKSRGRRGVRFGLAWWFVALVPAAQLRPFWIWAADRYAYAALPGLCAVLVVLVLPERDRWPAGRRGAFAALLAAAAFLTGQQLPRWTSSEELWRAHLAADPQHRIAVPGLARALLRRGERGRALRLLRRAARDQPDNPRVRRLLAFVLWEEGRLVEAEALLRDKGLDADRARLLCALGRRAEARAVVEAALRERVVPDVDLLALRARFRLENGDLQDAEEDARRVVAGSPQRPEAWLLLAEIRLRREDRTGAEEALAWAARLGTPRERIVALRSVGPGAGAEEPRLRGGDSSRQE
ncbi:MAG: tetratricopeptide repeat protein [Planctomycetota bacterium]|nr:MAG: tetratricopeptide repeat protein [Planctomycetota bacterium]